MARKKKTMDGNSAAAHVSYAFTEVAAIYPITPSSNMAEETDAMAARGVKNIFGQTVRVAEMESEGGAAGAVHGSLSAGALTTTYTASQGLLLMIPNMYKIAGELIPSVIHVSARCVSTHALNIFGDHSDVMACRQTGYAMLCSANVQEVMDLGAVAHLSTLKSRVPFLHFFDGFRTSHEIQKIEVWDYDELKSMVDMDDVQAFRARALNPERPVLRGSAENSDIFFQHREACNKYYNDAVATTEMYMNMVNEKLGTDYKLFNYYGAEDADRVIVAMGSVCDTIKETIDFLNARGEKVGMIKVHLYRPFSVKHLVDVIPDSVKTISVIDRTKEPGSLGEPLFLDVVAALKNSKFSNVPVYGGRYGLGSKDTLPAHIISVYNNMNAEKPKTEFTLSINDDVTNLSLDVTESPDTTPKGTTSCKFWGLGSDGTVGANKDSIKIIGDNTDMYAQGYFFYDSKKSGGITVSHLRFGSSPITSTYLINKANFVACHNPSYVTKYDMVQDIVPGGTFLLNCIWSPEELDKQLPAKMKRYIAENNINFYTINGIKIAEEVGLPGRASTILQSAFFKLANVMPIDEAVDFMKAAAKKSYGKKGDAVVEMNYKAIDAGVDAVHKVEVPASWSNPEADPAPAKLTGRPETVKMVEDLMNPIALMDGDSLPVSAFMGNPDGQFEQGASAYEKRGTAVTVPTWDAAKCIQCNQCAFVCSHATIRPFMLSEDEVKAAPANIKLADTKPKASEYKYTMSVSPLDCMGCGECITVCPVGAIEMVPQESQAEEQPVFDYLVANVGKKPGMPADNTVKGSQFNQPLLEFSGSCAGCAETSYARLITQLFGEHMYISNATGCSSIWGGPAATSPYTVNKDSNKGPAWANSLFEDNAEHGLGMQIGQEVLRDQAIASAEKCASSDKASAELKDAFAKFMETKQDTKANTPATEALVAELEKAAAAGCPDAKAALEKKDYLAKKSVWIFGGDGWAYDIGFGGLDHVLASGHNVNVMVFDTEMYSNTGGQASKASNIGEVCQFAAAGKEVGKKSLAEIAMSYGYVYVAQIALGANMAQAVKVLAEAEAYDGPSLIIGYAPCELHGVKGGMNHCQDEMKKAVAAGYWNLFSFNPALKAEGKNPFTLTSKPGDGTYQEFLNNETRYSRLTRSFPERAAKLFAASEEAAKARYEHLLRLVELYK